MDPADKRNLVRDVQDSTLVLGVKKGKIFTIKEKYGEIYDNLSISDALTLLLEHVENKNLMEALTPILEKIKLYETFR